MVSTENYFPKIALMGPDPPHPVLVIVGVVGLILVAAALFVFFPH